MKIQVEPTHYFNKYYDSKERFISYWHQINEIIKLNSKKALEIGIGNAFVCKYLKERGIKITTLDIDKKLKPDKVGSVLAIPFEDNFFDVVLCCEVLEHLPYENFHKALLELYRISQKYVILSLPDVNRAYRINIQIPKLGEIKQFIKIPRLKKPIHKFDGEHYWEIGSKNYPLNRIYKEIKKIGFIIKKDYRIFEHPYHHFFILKK